MCVCVYTCRGSITNSRHFCSCTNLFTFISLSVFFISLPFMQPVSLPASLHTTSGLSLSPSVSLVLLVAIWSFPVAAMKRLPFRIQIKLRAAPVTGDGVFTLSSLFLSLSSTSAHVCGTCSGSYSYSYTVCNANTVSQYQLLYKKGCRRDQYFMFYCIV